jgi:hypothetical protein
MRNEAKKIIFGFAKTSENEAKQDAKIKKERKRDTLVSRRLNCSKNISKYSRIYHYDHWWIYCSLLVD